MNFKRGIDPKESLGIGRLCKALKIEGLEISLRDPESSEINWSFKEVFSGKDLHAILASLENKKVPWDVIITKNNHLLSTIRKEVIISFRMVFIKKQDSITTGFNSWSRVNYSRIEGTDIVYEGVLYNMPKLAN
jgi:hypothetical protein